MSSLWKLYGLPDFVKQYRISVSQMITSTTWSFPHSWLITGFVTRVARRVPLVVQELLTFPEHMGSSPVFRGIRVARSLGFCVVICRSLFVLLSFYFCALCFRSWDLRILITPLCSSNYSYNYSWWYSMYIHILYLYFRQASLSPKQNFGAIENRDLKTSLRIIDSNIFWKTSGPLDEIL